MSVGTPAAAPPAEPAAPPGRFTEPVRALGATLLSGVSEVGDLTLFALAALRSVLRARPSRRVLLPCLYEIGVRSIPVVLITGGFIGMVLAVQSYDQLHMMHLENRLGAVVNVSLVKELGPVLAAVMLAGRVGSRTAAELGTMRVTEQIDAVKALGADPIGHLVVPRVAACVLLIPLLTVLADACGMFGGWLFSVKLLGISDFHYWHHTLNFITAYDFASGLLKSLAFGASIGVIACHRGFHCGAGAEGVGTAATESFVLSFMAILCLDFLLGVVLGRLYWILWPAPMTLM
ncbi:MlaE family ABC transporter permease [Alienimonas sp. DA493]|uniref:MlaE family ABC transporter permease n=1 Tax=Alienimonas sp. DA493 TaxID=3373605 RepID=UPI0037545DFE